MKKPYWHWTPTNLPDPEKQMTEWSKRLPGDPERCIINASEQSSNGQILVLPKMSLYGSIYSTKVLIYHMRERLHSPFQVADLGSEWPLEPVGNTETAAFRAYTLELGTQFDPEGTKRPMLLCEFLLCFSVKIRLFDYEGMVDISFPWDKFPNDEHPHAQILEKGKKILLYRRELSCEEGNVAPIILTHL